MNKKKDLKKHERQNIKRRYGSDWKTYLRSLELQEGKCAICGLQPKRWLKVDKLRRYDDPGFVKLLCSACHHVIQHCSRGEGRARLSNYLALTERH
jgi:hypothetical protein